MNIIKRTKNYKNELLLFLLTLVIKIPFLLINHIQEDSFITWRVAKNLKDYGVIGFNGLERISASTTHLYVFYSAFFQFIFGDNFISPILVCNSLLFGAGTIFLGKIFFSEKKQLFWFVILLNIIPPSLTASGVGMEYGLLFFLYTTLLYFGLYKEHKTILIVFPILIMWTRLDTAIFLGITFLVFTFYTKRWNWSFVVGGILGFMSVMFFNYFYFGELVNHTITAKKFAYPVPEYYNFKVFLYQLAYYGGFIKKFGLASFLTFLLYVLLTVALVIKMYQKFNFSTKVKIILLSVCLYSLVHIILFAYMRAYFDWYYWLPRVFMVSFFLVYIMSKYISNKKILYTVLLLFIGFYMLQILQSSAISYMENTQRMQMVNDLIKDKPSLHKSIVLEPAGKIPFYTNLYTIDEVGLVDKKMTEEMKKDFPNAWINLIFKYKPNYILTIDKKAGENKLYTMSDAEKIKFNKEYELVKSYPIANVNKYAPQYIHWIYVIRPIGKDYFLYKKKD